MGSNKIIDGCNVAKCEFLGKYNVCKAYVNMPKPCGCENNPDCYFKQLQRAKAEIEKLKEEVADLEDLAEFKEKYIRELSSNINVKIGQITAMEMFNKQANKYNLKYKQAFKEIEEIAYTTDFDIVDIQKILNEVLND